MQSATQQPFPSLQLNSERLETLKVDSKHDLKLESLLEVRRSSDGAASDIFLKESSIEGVEWNGSSLSGLSLAHVEGNKWHAYFSDVLDDLQRGGPWLR
jgi:hypothetical protein